MFRAILVCLWFTLCSTPAAADPPIHVRYLQWADSEALARILDRTVPDLDLGSVRIVADVPTNSLVIVAEHDDFAALESIVSLLDVPVFSPAPTALPIAVVEALLRGAEPSADEVGLYCHVVEGWRCFHVPVECIDTYDGNYDPELEADQLPRELSALAILVLHPKRVEHARGNGVKIRCNRSVEHPGVRCGIDWGDGFVHLPISGE